MFLIVINKGSINLNFRVKFRKCNILHFQTHGAKLKKYLFGIAYPGFHLVGRSVGFFLLFLNIYYLHMDGNGKKNLRFGKKN